MRPIRAVLVDDNREFSSFLARYLDSVPDIRIEVVANEVDGRTAVTRVREVKPDIVFMDVSMPSVNGFEATRAIRTTAQCPRIVILTVHDGEEYRRAAASVGADAFVVKSEIFRSLVPLLHRLFPDARTRTAG